MQDISLHNYKKQNFGNLQRIKLEKLTSVLFDFILPPSKGIVFKSIEVPSLSPFLSTFEINILIRRPINNRIMSTVISTMEITPQCGTK
jgi:hypothetical protein